MRWTSYRMCHLALALLACLATAHRPALAQRIAEPIALFNGADLVACGVRLFGDAGSAPVEAELTIHRSGASTRFRIMARWSARGAPLPPLVAATLETRTQSTGQRLAAVAPPPEWDVAAEGAIAGLDGGLLMQELMVSGGRLVIATSPGEQRPAEIAGPLPQLVRASYLNCAGDLFRPVE